VAQTLDDVLARIKDPHNWADPEYIVQILAETPSVRGMVYGNLAEIQFSHWLVALGVPMGDQVRDDDHAKTKSDRTIVWQGKRYTVQVKSMQTNSIRATGEGTFRAGVQCDGSDRRDVTLPNGHVVNTTNYVAGEFMVLATAMHAFTGEWDFAFRLNSTLDRTTSKKYVEEDRPYLLKTLVNVTWPLEPPWTTDLFGLLAGAPDLGETLDEGSAQAPGTVRPPGTAQTVRIDSS